MIASPGSITEYESLEDERWQSFDDCASIRVAPTEELPLPLPLPLPPKPATKSSHETASASNNHHVDNRDGLEEGWYNDDAVVAMTKTMQQQPAGQQEQQQMQQEKRQVTPKRKSSSSRRRKSIGDKDVVEEELVRVEQPAENDILCGQSRVCASHGGNKRFSAVLDQFADRYDAATSKQEKMTMTKEIVAILKTRGRFLKCKDGMWEEISTVAARDKVSHALRTRVASWKRQHQQLQDGNKFSLNNRHRSSLPTSRRKSKIRKEGRRASTTSIPTNGSGGINNVSFDVNDPTSTAVVNNLMKAQQEIFAELTTPKRSKSTTDGCEPYPIEHLESIQPHAEDLAHIFGGHRDFDNEYIR